MIQPAETIQGAGVGLRMPHVGELLNDADSDKPQFEIPWLELLADNWLSPHESSLGGINRQLLQALADRFALTLHGVGLSLGSVGELDFDYLKQIKQLQKTTGARWYSEHCSFSWEPQQQAYAPDLLPLPYTDEAVALLATHIRQVQDFLGEPLLLENVSSYVQYSHSQLTEAEFINAVIREADCLLLLDINNVYVTSYNEASSYKGTVCGHETDAEDRPAAARQHAERFLQQMQHQRVKEIHLAGHQAINSSPTDSVEGYLLDTHNQPVCPEVWSLYQGYIQQYGERPTLIEWDSELPSLARLDSERGRAQTILEKVRNAPHLEPSAALTGRRQEEAL